MRDLFDLSFSRFLVPQLVRWLYLGWVILAILALVGALMLTIPTVLSSQILLSALEAANASSLEIESAGTRRNIAIAVTIIAPFLALGMVVIGRVVAEMTVVVFSIAESLKRER